MEFNNGQWMIEIDGRHCEARSTPDYRALDCFVPRNDGYCPNDGYRQ
ncbi:MAG: hypothetical protein LBT42_04750 [Tannerella sp.]|nr:hypothetical protein [Tannerella sp.]